MSAKKAPQEAGAALQPSALKPAFPDLRKKHGTVERLEAHLNELEPAALKALILSGAFPEAKSNLRHCVYCHKTYDTASNFGNCSVEHFRELIEPQPEYSSDEMFECCGKIMNNDDWMEGMSRAEDEEPYCYEGVHWEREITTDDEAEIGEEDLGLLSQDGEKLQRVWWREWREHGDRCEKMGCMKTKPTRSVNI